MRLLDFFGAVTLFEAAKDRYWQVFQNLIPVAKEMGKEREFEVEIDNELKWAMNILQKSDKVTWYLRYVKLGVLIRLIKSEGIDPQIQKRVQKTYDKLANQVATKSGISANEIPLYAQQVTSQDFKRRMEHFMSLDLRGIEEYAFVWQKPQDIWDDWTPIEQAWQQKASKLIDIDREGVETVIKFPDGSEWINLNKSYCNIEAQAMGHCGNTASYQEDHTILSYRTLEDTEKGQMWKPRLTFVLDTSNGLLGETKGRANQKPDKKYHEVILALLKNPIVKGIKGGGHEAQNNFHLDDLPDEVVEALVEEKPGLATIGYDYKKRGMTKELLGRMESMWGDTGEEFPEYKDKDKAFLFPTAGDIDEFVKYHGGDQAEYVMKIFRGDEHLNFGYDDDAPVEDLWEELPTKIQHEVGKWLIENHNDSVEEWKEGSDTDFDGTDSSDTWNIINEYDIDEVKDALTAGMMSGYEVGAQNEMYTSIKGWIKDLPNERGMSISLYPGMEKGGWDDPQFLHIPEETMVDIVSDYLDDVEYEGDLSNFFGFEKMSTPYNGWEGYDERAAIEYAEERLHEEGVLSR